MSKKARKLDDYEARQVLARALEDGALDVSAACRAIRALEGLSQADLAAQAGLDVKVIKAIESGAGNPRLSSLQGIADCLNLRVAFVRPSYEAGLFDPRQRAADEQRSRDDDAAAVASGRQSGRERDRQNAMRIGESVYELPRLR